MTTLNTPPPDAKPTGNLASMQQKVIDRLGRLGARVRRQIALDGFARGLCVLLGLLALSVVLDWWLEISRPIRIVYWLVTLAAAAHFLYHYALKPLSRKFGPIDLAEAVDTASGARGSDQVAPRVATVLQLPDMLGDDKAISGNMISSAVTRSYDSLEREDFERHVSRSHMMNCVAAVAAAVILSVGVASLMHIFANGAFGTWAQRWLMLTNAPYERNTTIEVLGLDEDGRLIVPKGEPATIRIQVENKTGEVEEVEIVTRPEGGRTRTHNMDRYEEGDYRYDLLGTQVPVRATVRSGDNDASFDIVPVDRPSGTVQLFYTHPADGVRRELRFDGTDGGLALLDLNRVELIITANVPIREARYTENTEPGDQPGTIEPVGDDGTRFRIRWEHHKRERFRVELVSEEAGLVSQPIAISVGLKSDRAPRVRIQSTGVGTRITPNALIPLTTIDARDDYGLTDLRVELLRNRPGEDVDPNLFDPVPVFAAERDEDGNLVGTLPETVNGKLDIEIEEFGVRPTDVVRMTGVALDDRYTGAQRGASTTLTFRIVTHEDLAREIKARQEQSRNAFRQAMEACRDIQTQMTQAESPGDYASHARRFRALQRDVWKVHSAIAASAEEMRLNRLAGTREEGSRAHELIQENVLTPMATLHRGLMTQQREALENADTADAATLAQIEARQQEVIDEMNRILTAMEEWANMVDLINQLNEVIQTQRGLLGTLKDLFERSLDDGPGDDGADELEGQFNDDE